MVLLLPGTVLASAGRVTFAIGDVRIERGDARLEARRGLELEPGDTVRTGSGRAQLRFRDGGYMSLQPDTVFRIDEYRFSGEADGSERSFFSLLKGGLRAITGLIGHRDRNSYRVRTPTVTIGIRGTGYTVLVDANGNTHASVGEGEIVLRNRKGELRLRSWQSARAGSGKAPQPAPQRPYLPPQPVNVYTPEYQITDDRDEEGNPVIISGSRLQSGPGYVVAYNAEYVGAPVLGSAAFATAQFDNNSGLLSYTSPTDGSADIGTAQLADVGSVNSNLGWGRWTGGTSNVNGLASPETHYVVALAPAQMPTSGTATYSLSGFTTPTGQGVTIGGLQFVRIVPTLQQGTDAIIGVDFSQGTIASSFDVVFAQDTYSVNVLVSGPINGPIIAIPNAAFAGSGGNVTCSQSNSCGGYFVFGGDSLNSAGMVYTFTNADADINGAFGATGPGVSGGAVGQN